MSEIDNTPTTEDITQNYKAMGDSVELINGIIDGSKMTDGSSEDKSDSVKRNVEHLKIQVSKDWYVTDSVSRAAPANKSSIEAAITAGDSYIA